MTHEVKELLDALELAIRNWAWRDVDMFSISKGAYVEPALRILVTYGRAEQVPISDSERFYIRFLPQSPPPPALPKCGPSAS
jgi:hypothetical protein